MKDKEEWENVISNIARINSILPDKERQNKKNGSKIW